MPVLFYALALYLFVTQQVDALIWGLSHESLLDLSRQAP
jgi:hypothetical protein